MARPRKGKVIASDANATVAPKAKTVKRLTDDEMRKARERYERGINREQDNREQAREDLRFKVGDQWPEAERKRRGDRPALVFNRMLSFVRQVTGDIRQNKPAIRVRPNGDGADKDTAEMFAGLIRNIEQQSHAGYIYAQAADAATSCGFGYFRLVTEYATADSFEQDIRLKGIPNPLSVVFDPDAIELDRSDARWVFVYSMIPKEDFERDYPKARSEDFEKLDKGLGDGTYSEWFTSDGVRIAEYWEKVPVTKTLSLLSDGRTICLEDYDEAKAMEMMAGAEVVRTRDVKTHKVIQHIISGAEELEDPVEWATDDIPIIPCLGEETYVDENRVSYGLIRFAKDPQRALNYARSTSIEVTALQPKAPYKLSAAMIAGHEAMWNNAGAVNYPYLVYNSDPNMLGRAPEREQPPVPAAGLITEAQMASDDIKAITGIHDAALGAQSNETSGRAITARQQEGDVSTFVYVDNMALSVAVAGKQLIKLIPKIYDTKRTHRILYDDGTEETVKANVPGIGRNGQQGIIHDPAKGFYDLSVGKYDVVVEAGPGFTTRRQEASEGVMEMMKILGPAAAPLLGPRLAELQDWPKATDIATDLKKLLPPELRDPQTGPDGQPLPPPPPPPDPETVKAQAQIAAMQDKHKFEVAKAQSDMELKKVQAQDDAQLAQQKLMADVQLAQARAEAEAQIAKDKAEFDMTLAAWEAEQKANLAIRQQAAVDKAGEGKRNEAEGRLQQVFGGAVNDFTSQVADFLARMEQTAASSKQRRRVLRTYRDENDNLVGEEHFVDDDAGAPPA